MGTWSVLSASGSALDPPNAERDYGAADGSTGSLDHSLPNGLAESNQRGARSAGLALRRRLIPTVVAQGASRQRELRIGRAGGILTHLAVSFDMT